MKLSSDYMSISQRFAKENTSKKKKKALNFKPVGAGLKKIKTLKKV